MSEKYSFFDSVDSDRAYYAADWALHLSKYFTNGIFDNGLQVVVSDGMNVSVSTGDANINGYRYTNDSEKIIAVANADGTLNRIDNIVVRLDIPNRQITTEIVTGDFAESAVAPTLTRGTSIYDLRIAKISIPAGTTEITEDLITDTRFDDDDCGNVICAVQTPDFSDVLAQYIALWEDFINTETESFENWFKEIKGELSEDQAGNLQLQINELEEQINDKSALIDTIYPIGAIYISTSSTSPADLFGGTWEQIEDQFLLACGSTYEAGDTGGSSTDSHTHEFRVRMSTSHAVVSDVAAMYNDGSKGAIISTSTGNTLNTNSALDSGSTWNYEDGTTTVTEGTTYSASTSNMPPYLAVYCWCRTA